MKAFAGIVMAGILAGCGTQAPSTGVAPIEAPRLTQASQAAESVAELNFVSPRYPFTTDKIELRTGRVHPVDDGMGPAGDLRFFYDGEQFHVVANQGGGTLRLVAEETGEYSSGPLPLQEGHTYRVRLEDGVARLRILDLDPGTMRLTSPMEGTGTGSVRYEVDLLVQG